MKWKSLSRVRLFQLYSPWNSPGQNIGVGSLSLLQGIFPTQGSNPGLPHCRQILSQLSQQGSPGDKEGNAQSRGIVDFVVLWLNIVESVNKVQVMCPHQGREQISWEGRRINVWCGEVSEELEVSAGQLETVSVNEKGRWRLWVLTLWERRQREGLFEGWEGGGGRQDKWKERRGRGGEGGEEDREKGRQVNFTFVSHRNPSSKRRCKWRSDGSTRNLPLPYGFPWDVQKKSPPSPLLK